MRANQKYQQTDRQERSQKTFFATGSNASPFFQPVDPSGQGYAPDLQRQEVETEEALLNREEINSAIRYNRLMYPPAQLRLLQRGLGITETGRSDGATALAIAAYQQAHDLTVDGKAGPDTFAAIQADTAIAGKEDLLLFSVLDMANGISITTGGGTTDMLGHFKVEIHLPPGSCEDYEYRQFICGEVEFLPAGASAATPFQSLNGLFTTQPGGALPHIPNFHEDGNTTLHSRYGHRALAARPENKYVDADGNTDQAHGCTFLGEDFPGITGRITNPGETYDFDIRFLGVVNHKTRGRVAERWWNVRSTFVI